MSQIHHATEIVIDEAAARRVLAGVRHGLVRGIGIPEPGQMCVEAVVTVALGLPFGDDPVCVDRAVCALKMSLNDATGWSSNAARAKGLERLALAQLGSAGILDTRDFAKRVAEFSIRVMTPVALRAAASLQKDTHHKGALEGVALRCEKEGTQESAESAAVWAVESAEAAEAAAEWAESAAESAAEAAAKSAAKSADSAAKSAAEWAEWAEWAEAAESAAVWAVESAEAAEAEAEAEAEAAEAASAWAAESAKSQDKVLSQFAEGVVQILVEMKAPGCRWLFLTEEQ